MNILAAFVIALVCSLIFLFVTGSKGRSSFFPLILFFMILFLAGVATQYWVTPFGPVYWGVSWTPLIFILLIFSILLSAQPIPGKTREGDETANVVSVFIWLLLVLLLIAAVSGFFKASPVLA